MNELGVLAVGAALRCTAFGLLGMLVYALLRRRGPSAGSLVALASLLLLVMVSALSLSPAPRWWSLPPRAFTALAHLRPARPAQSPATSSPAALPAPPPAERPRPAAPAPSAAPAAFRSTAPTAAAFVDELLIQLQQPRPAARASVLGWPAALVVLVLACAAVGLVRLLVGLRAVHLLRRRSQPIADADLADMLEILRAEASCTRKVAIHESAELTTPATVGWRRPVILLPACWREWDGPERKVVLAHELAHVCRNDYLSGLLAQVSLAIHFYHPLAHWLLGRLRLQQELAADAWGARLAGGNPLYLTTLAQMALRQADRPVSWPARAFLPTRGTFLRRIEMLRNVQSLPPPSLSRFARSATIGCLALAGLLIGGLRGAEGPAAARAQAGGGAAAGPTPLAQAAVPDGHIDLRYVPAATDLMLAARPAKLLARPEFQPIAEALKRADPGGHGRLPLEDLDQVLVLWLRPVDNPAADGRRNVLPEPSAFLLHSDRALDWKAVGKAIAGETQEATFQGQTYQRGAGPGGARCYFLPDEHTMILASEADLQFLIGASRGPQSHHAWDDAWNEVNKGEITLALGSSWLTQRLVPKLDRAGDPNARLDAFAPLWTRARGYAVGLDLSKGLAVDIVASCGTDEGAEKVAQTAGAVITLAGNMMDGFRQQIAAAPRDAVEPMQLVADTLDPLLQKVRTEHKGRIVHVRSSTAVDFQSVVKVVLPAFGSARLAARRSQSVNHMKQLGLAMHNYAQANGGKFPPAVLVAPDGKTTYSWRVALLPYLDQQNLYNEYRFTEPWDGPNNRNLIDKIPEVFRHDDADQGKLAYYALVGRDTVFGESRGTPLPHITDGLSNTLMLVEATRDIPWTKPEDIPYEPGQPLPRLGGYTPEGFNALFSDGSVRFIKSSINETVLRALITRANGEVINSSEY